MIQSEITHVTVFTDRARITRTAKTAVSTGVQKVEIGDLPLSMLAESVRASAKGTARARLLGVSTRIENYAETPATSVRELQAHEESLKDKLSLLTGRAGAAQKEQGAIEGMLARSNRFAKEIAKGSRSADDELAVFARLRAQLAQLQEEGLTLARERRELERELNKVQRQLQEHGSAQPKQRNVAVAEFDVAESGDLNIELKHMVWGANWTPLYDMRTTDAGLDVRYLAQLTQNSGEDWKGVRVSLSTAQPGVALDIPELEPWYVMPKPPPPPPRPQMPMAVPRARAAKMADDMMVAAAAPAAYAAPAERAVEEVTATVSESGPALTYDLPATADVPGNGEPRKVAVGAFTLKPSLDFITAPKVEAVCYRRCKVKNDSAFTMLPGEAQLFDNDDFLGGTHLEMTAPGQEIELALGADERVRVERKLLQRDVDKTFLSDKRRTRVAYKIDIENLRKEAATVIVRDQLPLAKHEEIKVKLESAEPKPAEHSDLNQLEWKLQLPAGGRAEIKFEFTVEHPRAMEIAGFGV